MLDARLRTIMLVSADTEVGTSNMEAQDQYGEDGSAVVLPRRSKASQHAVDVDVISDTCHDRPSRIHVESKPSPGLVDASTPATSPRVVVESERQGIQDRLSGRGRAACRSTSPEDTARAKQDAPKRSTRRVLYRPRRGEES